MARRKKAKAAETTQGRHAARSHVGAGVGAMAGSGAAPTGADGPVEPDGGGSTGPVDLDVRPGGRRLGELLVDQALLTRDELIAALMQQSERGERIGALLVELGAIDEDVLAEVLASQVGLAVAELRHAVPEPDAVAALPESVVRSLTAMPIRLTGDALVVAVADPTDETVRRRLAEAYEGRVELEVGPPAQIRRAIDNCYRAIGGVDRFVQAFEATDTVRRRDVRDVSHDDTAGDAPVVQVVNLILTQALRDRTSDVHIEPQDTRLRVRFRIDGALHEALELPAAMAPALVSRLKIMGGMNIVERRRSQDGQFTMEVDDRRIDVRVATTATIWGEKCVMRLLDKSRSHFRMGQLGMPDDTAETFRKLVRSPFGMVLCAGPTGSGKTTTLYATLSEIDDPSRNIMTIEDPVEYIFPSVNQIQTNEQAGLTFASGLKSILRQDPDVILVGEIRDVETARIAVQSALTGHFVLSSLHATDSAAAVHRFLDMGIESFLIASSVVAVVGQRLVRRICETCRVEYRPSDEELAFYADTGAPPKATFYRGRGCNFCAGTGFQDRIGVYELLRITPEIKRLIVGWATQDELQRMAIKQGMRTLQEEAISLVRQDVTTIDEVIRSIYAL